MINFYVDGYLSQAIDLASRPVAAEEFGDVHLKPYFMLPDLAIDRDAAGPPDATAAWPRQTAIDRLVGCGAPRRELLSTVPAVERG